MELLYNKSNTNRVCKVVILDSSARKIVDTPLKNFNVELKTSIRYVPNQMDNFEINKQQRSKTILT